jgi:molybdate/tungstate transport system substrate-binding protein
MKIPKTFLIFFFSLFISSYFTAGLCQNQSDALSSKLIIFHAGSLSVPMKEIAQAFMEENPGVNVLTEAAGSLESARKITELKRECDIMASADYSVIDQLLIPEFASWNIKFASNEMAIVFTGKSRRNLEISKDNWYNIMLDKNVQIGRADPNSDPCGYRSVLVAKLAEKYYQQNDLANKLLQKNINNIRPKETDLLALLETGNVDYIFLYRSVAEQHHLKYILLPDEVNLKQTEMAEIYGSVSVEINGKKPGEKMIQKGEPMVYGITIPNNAPNKEVALAFVQFLLTPEKGMAIMKKLGQDSVIPSESKSYEQLPAELKAFAKSELKTN